MLVMCLVLQYTIRNLEPNCQYSCSSSSEIVTKSLQPSQNLCRFLKTFACVQKMLWGGVGGGVCVGNSGSGLW